jgi:hypothetical protein
MKILKTTIALTLLLFCFSSCDQLEDLAEIDLPFSLDETFGATNADGEFNSTTTINALDDGNISANLDNIKAYSIEKVSITITNLVTDTSPSLSNLNLSIGGNQYTIDGLPSLAVMQTQGEMEFTIDTAGLEAIRVLIAAGADIAVIASATVTDGPASFDLTLSIAGNITVGP